MQEKFSREIRNMYWIFSHRSLRNVCCSFFWERKPLSCWRQSFYHIKRQTVIDTGSCVNTSPESLFKDVKLKDSKLITSEKPPFKPFRTASGQQVSIERQTNNSFQTCPQHFQASCLILPKTKSVFRGNLILRKHINSFDPNKNW